MLSDNKGSRNQGFVLIYLIFSLSVITFLINISVKEINYRQSINNDRNLYETIRLVNDAFQDSYLVECYSNPNTTPIITLEKLKLEGFLDDSINIEVIFDSQKIPPRTLLMTRYTLHSNRVALKLKALFSTVQAEVDENTLSLTFHLNTQISDQILLENRINHSQPCTQS